jgi:hypothetical protein
MASDDNKTKPDPVQKNDALSKNKSCLYRKLDSAIIMMKSAEDRHSCDAAYVLDGAMDRSVFAKRPMSSQLVIISGILRQDPA